MKLESTVERYTRFIVRRSWLVLGLFLAVATALSVGWTRLAVDTDYKIFFDADNEKLVAFESLQRVYAKDDSIFFVLEPEEGDVFTEDSLAAVETLTREAWKIPYARRVDSITNYQHSQSVEDDLEVGPLVPELSPLSEAERSRIRTIATSEPQLVDRLVSPTGRVTGVNVRLALPGEDRAEVPRAVNEARRLAEELRREHPKLKVYLTGLVVLDNAFSEAVVTDLTTLVPLMYAAMFLMLLWLLGSASGAAATLIVIAVSAIPALGAAGWWGLGITPPLAQAPTMIMTLAVADSVHLLSTMFREMRKGLSRQEAIVVSMRTNYQAVFLTSLTTAIGFLSMNFSDSPPFRHLGNVTALGVVLAYLAAVVFLPALVAVMPMHLRERAAVSRSTMNRLADFIVRRRRRLLWGASLVVLAAAAFVPRNHLDDGFINYFDESTAFRADTNFTLDHLTGIYTIEYSLGSGQEGGVGEPAYLSKLEEFADWYRRQPHVVHVDALTETMKRLNRSLNGDAAAFYRLPENRELAAQYLLLYEMSLPYGLDLSDRVNVDKSASRVTVTLDNLSSRELQELAARAEAWLRQNAPESMFARGASTSVIFVDIALRNIKSMLFGTTLAFFLISGCLVVALRSFRFGLLSLVPNLVPAVVAFGVWGLIDGRVNLGLSVVTGMTFGIVVDDTVHFLIKYLRARRDRGLESEEAARYALETVGQAMVSTSVMLVAGFSVLALSGFVVNSDMGKMTAMTIALALAADLFLLPPLLIGAESLWKKAAEAKAAVLGSGPVQLEGER